MDYGKCKAVFSAANCKKREHRQNYCDEIIHKMEAHKMIKDEKTSIRPLDDDDNMFIKYSDIFPAFCSDPFSYAACYTDTALFCASFVSCFIHIQFRNQIKELTETVKKKTMNESVLILSILFRHRHQSKVKCPTSLLFTSGVVQFCMFEYNFQGKKEKSKRTNVDT